MTMERTLILTGYCRQWVLYFSEIATPLYALAKSSVRASLLGKPKHEPVVYHLEEALQQSPSPSTPNYKKLFHRVVAITKVAPMERENIKAKGNALTED